MSTPMPAAASGSTGQRTKYHMAIATTVLLTRPPSAPSTVFLGLMSVSLVRPRDLPAQSQQAHCWRKAGLVASFANADSWGHSACWVCFQMDQI